MLERVTWELNGRKLDFVVEFLRTTTLNAELYVLFRSATWLDLGIFVAKDIFEGDTARIPLRWYSFDKRAGIYTFLATKGRNQCCVIRRTILFIRQQKFVQVWYVPINMIFELFIYQQAEFQYNIIIDGVFPAIFLQNWPCQPNFSIVSFKKWISEKLVKC